MSEKDRAAQDEIEVTPQMIEAGYEAIGPFDRDFWEQTKPEKMRALLRTVYSVMRGLERDGTVNSV